MTSSASSAETQTRICRIATEDDPFVLHNGTRIGPVDIAYETYGTLSPKRDNAILLLHALSGSQHAAGYDPVGPANKYWTDECHKGWWDDYIGPGRAIDTDKYFVVCCNYLGGCYGSTGPSSINPATGKPYGGDFPWPNISDVIDTQVRVLDSLGIDKVLAVIGSSLGGFGVLDFATRYPARVRCAICVASGLRATVLQKAMNFEQIFAIGEDSRYCAGHYYDVEEGPWRGLALARMIAHKTFISLEVLETRARSEIIQPTDVLSGLQLEHQVESYLLHQGKKFIQRFDANSYLRIVNMWQSFDITRDLGNGDASKVFAACKGQTWLLFTINTDVCFFPGEQEEIADALEACGVDHQYLTVHSLKGHDSFLLESNLYSPHIVFKLTDVLNRARTEG